MKQKFLIFLPIVISVFLGFVAFQRWSGQIISFLHYGYRFLPPFIERRTAIFGERHVTFLFARFAPGEMTWHLANSPSMPRVVSDWRSHLEADIVVNGSYFSQENVPTGFYQTATWPSVVDWPVFADESAAVGYTFAATIVDSNLQLSYIPDMPRSPSPVTASFASFPTLIVNDVPMVAKDSGALARRTVLATDAQQNIFIIVTESGELSLYEMAQWLAQQPEDFTVAGNIDGGPSTGLSVSAPWNIEVRSAMVPNVIWGRKAEKD